MGKEIYIEAIVNPEMGAEKAQELVWGNIKPAGETGENIRNHARLSCRTNSYDPFVGEECMIFRQAKTEKIIYPQPTPEGEKENEVFLNDAIQNLF